MKEIILTEYGEKCILGRDVEKIQTTETHTKKK